VGSGFPNRTQQVTDLGGGRIRVVTSLVGTPCGVTTGGSLFTIDLAAQGPTGAGSVSLVSVAANDCAGTPIALNEGSAATVNVPGRGITLSPSSLPAAVSGSAYSQTLSASGGSPPYAFTLIAGALPAGITLASSGVLSGTPAAHGSFSFTVRATEPAGCGGRQAYTLVVGCPTIAVTPALVPDAAVGAAYATTFIASGGLAPYTYAVTSGALPAGLSLSSSGHLTGTPTVNGTASFTVTATDSAGCTGATAYVLDVFSGAPVSTLQAAVSGSPSRVRESCARVPFTFTRGESDSARSVRVSFQLEPGRLSLCGTPTASCAPRSVGQQLRQSLAAGHR
jgi:hypothetical protein